MKNLIVFVCLLFSSASFAQTDYGMETVFRTFPSGFAIRATAGYSIPFYKKDDKVLFGYIRPAVAVETSGVVNTAVVKLDINPVSFLNIYIGKSHTNRNYEEFDGFDCELLICSSKVNRDLYGVRMALAHGKVFYMIALKYYGNEFEGTYTGSYIDEISTLVHVGKKSVLRESHHAFGYDFSEKLTLGYLGIISKMRNNEQESQMHLLFGNYKFKENWEVMGGLGIFKTREDAKVGTALALLKWTPKKGLPLF